MATSGSNTVYLSDRLTATAKLCKLADIDFQSLNDLQKVILGLESTIMEGWPAGLPAGRRNSE